MLLNTPNIKKFIKRKLTTAVLVLASFGAFATLGDDDKKVAKKETFSTDFNFRAKNFSLKTGYNYRSNNLLELNSNRVITLNTTTVFQKGNVTYVLPLKRKVVLDKIKFNPVNR
jgi:hypothetical protein